jgi:two-component system, sensor histidine kinase and response regulator
MSRDGGQAIDAKSLWDVATWTPDALLVVDRDGRIVIANHTAYELFGYADGTMVGLSVDQLVPSHARDAHVLRRAQFAESPKSRQMAAGRLLSAVRADGGTFSVEVGLASLPGADGLVACSVRDIGVQGRAQHLLRLQHAALEAAANGIMITDRRGVIQWANPAFSEMTGYAIDEVVGRDPSFLKSGQHDAAFYQGLWDKVTSGDAWRGAITNRKKDGSLYVEEQTIAPVHAPTGEISHFIAIKQDVTERRRFEETLREAKNAAEAAAHAKTEFLANTSHELRTPLNALLGLSELLLDSDLSHRQRAMLDTIRESGETLLAIINDLLDLSKLEADKLELELGPVEVEPLFAAAMAQAAPRAVAKGVELVWAIDPDVPAWIVADELRVTQVLLNLVGNALKFTDDGEVEVRIALAEARGAPPAPGGTTRIRVSVRDTGLGIPRDRHHLLFKSFSQLESGKKRRYGGTGLGLAISKSLAEQMGGGIEVESEGVPGRGSCFTFELAAKVAEPHGSAAPPSPPLAGRRVAVIADNAALVDTLSLTLLSLGAEPVAVAASAGVPEDVAAAIVDESASIEERLDGPPVIWLARVGAPEDGFGGREPVIKPVRQRTLASALIAALGLSTTRHDTRPPPDAEPLSMPRARLLVADDSPVGQQVAMAQLTRLGLRADVVSDGMAALAAIASGRYDLALLDVRMPELDGLEVARAVRSLPGPASSTVLVALTASAMAGDRERCIEAGMDDYLSKPVRLATLEAMIRRALGMRPPRSTRLDVGPISEIAELSDVIDRATIHELRGELGEAAFQEVMGTFGENGRALLAAAADAHATGDLRGLRQAVHTLKGSAAACGAPLVARVSAEVEALIDAGQQGAIAGRLASIGAAFDAFLAALQGPGPPS